MNVEENSDFWPEEVERQIYLENMPTEELKELLDRSPPVGTAYLQVLGEYNRRLEVK